ncbi:transcriptional regulator [Plantactinospora sp. B24E8]|uniref:transcriptional regulator n=1 Tax=Plantactinospora sp. B24E8 TaxID=3153567 RepID=UPI00325E4038
MTVLTDQRWLVLHALRCIGFANLARIATATGLDAADVESELIDLAVAGLVRHEAGDFGGWGLTGAGRNADTTRTADELRTTGTRAAVTEAYDRFLPLNTELLDLCTAWQTRLVDGIVTVNDHHDPGYDARVLDLFVTFDRRAEVVCTALSTVLPRYGRYRVRLADALARVTAGEREYLTDHLEAYHTVWFQLHEDLLATLGIPR